MTAATAVLACCSCGQLSPSSETVSRVIGGQTPAGNPTRAVELTLGRCPACQANHDAASVLMQSHPALAARLGNARAHDVAEGVLMAFAALDQAPRIDASSSNADLALWIRHLGTVGLSLTWQGRVQPVGPQSSAYPWAHLDDDDRRRLRTAYGAALKELIDRKRGPVALHPPAGGGCLFCGIGSVPMAAAEVVRLHGPSWASQQVWREIRGVNPASIGGRISPDRLSGYLCPSCADAVDSVGSVGQSALFRALLHHLDAEQRTDEAQRLRIAGADAQLVAWAVDDQPANQKPWGHLTLVP